MKATVPALLVSAFLMAGAYAQAPTAPAHARDSSSRAMMSDTERNADVQRRIVDLHSKLGITPVEESLWTAVAQTMRDNASQLDTAIDKRENADTTAIDDLNAYGNVVQAHADGIKKLSAVFSPLYASMSDQQRKVADVVFAQAGHHQGKNEPQAMK